MKSIMTVLIVILVVSGSVQAQPPGPVGGEFQVNTYTTGRQAYPAVAAFVQGGFVVSWESYGSYETDIGINPTGELDLFQFNFVNLIGTGSRLFCL